MTERARKRQQAAKAKADAQSSTPLPQQPPQQKLGSKMQGSGNSSRNSSRSGKLFFWVSVRLYPTKIRDCSSTWSFTSSLIGKTFCKATVMLETSLLQV